MIAVVCENRSFLPVKAAFCPPFSMVMSHMPQVRAVAALPAVKDNTDSGYFQTAKLIGDKRATVAEKFFGRPFKRVMITDSGVVAP